VTSLFFSYPDRSSVLSDVTLGLVRGDRVGLIGPNGAGKTTLFLLISGVLSPSAGSIAVTGKPVQPGRFAPEVAYLFQSPDDQLFSATVFDDVAFGPLNMGLEEPEVEDRVQSALEKVQSTDLSGRSPHHLSGGEKRLAALATILAMTPEVLLLDEPTANLDNASRRNVINVLRDIEETLFVASHDLEFLLETCSQVVLLDSGRIVAQGPIREVLGNEALMMSHHLEKPHSLLPHAGAAHDHRGHYC
jgi:cobalt/nickel transport system ATP-binding protein